jgi:hypothetical protein
VTLVPTERRLRNPMLRLSLFRSRQFTAINVMTLLYYGALSAASYLVILECELRLGYSAAQAGAALIPESVIFLFLAPVSGAMVKKFGARWLMASGALAVAAGYCWLSAAHPGQSYASGILPGILLWGLGLGLSVTPLTAAVLAAVGDTDLGEASGINDASSRIGGVIVIAPGARADRGDRRARLRPRAGARLPALDDRHGRALRGGRARDRAIRQRRPDRPPLRAADAGRRLCGAGAGAGAGQGRPGPDRMTAYCRSALAAGCACAEGLAGTLRSGEALAVQPSSPGTGARAQSRAKSATASQPGSPQV